ncbi:MAG: alanine:cation symporter family protein [Rickettsiaceae bacterium H1]|nr:alanine:cation symporter family protein [Rickettsiaceae bacterium H1]
MKYLALLIFLIPSFTYASGFDAIINNVEYFLHSILFIEIFGIPLIVLMLVLSSVFYTIKFKFVNIRLFKHGLEILRGKHNKEEREIGDINHFQAFATAVAGTIGLGTVAGVAVAVSIGGPGAVIWMMLAGFLGMSTKFTEVTLGFKYRVLNDENHNTFGGPFQYIKAGLSELGLVNVSKVLAFVYAILLILAALFASIPFQANQTISVIKGYYSWIDNNLWLFAAFLTFLVGVVILGGVKRVANVSSALVPIMAVIYVFSCLVIIAFNFEKIGFAIKIMLCEAWNGHSAFGGFMGTFIAGIRRAVFANEAGIGTSPIAHAATKENQPIKAGLVAMLEPCIDTMIICFLTGFVIVITGAYNADNVGEGILITRQAFSTVSNWFPILLSVSVPFFAFSTMIAFSYYCEMGWLYLFNSKRNIIYCRLLIVLVVFFSSISDNFLNLAKLGDMLFMCLAVPNLITMYLLSNKVSESLQDYINSINFNK